MWFYKYGNTCTNVVANVFGELEPEHVWFRDKEVVIVAVVSGLVSGSLPRKMTEIERGRGRGIKRKRGRYIERGERDRGRGERERGREIEREGREKEGER